MSHEPPKPGRHPRHTVVGGVGHQSITAIQRCCLARDSIHPAQPPYFQVAANAGPAQCPHAVTRSLRFQKKTGDRPTGI